MFEDIFQLGEKPFFIDKLQTLKVQEMGLKLFLHLRDGLKDTKGKFSSNNRSHMHDPFKAFIQAVNTGGDDSLNGIGNLDIGGSSA